MEFKWSCYAYPFAYVSKKFWIKKKTFSIPGFMIKKAWEI